jgi:hypothetical protein
MMRPFDSYIGWTRVEDEAVAVHEPNRPLPSL